MPDLTLYEFSDLEIEELKNRLDIDYSIISSVPEKKNKVRVSNQGYIKKFWQNIKACLKELYKTIQLHSALFPGRN